jgi:stage V sporulation protein SpoVS
MTDETANVEKTDETDNNLLLVSGSKGSKEQDKEYVKKLSNAILQVYSKHDSVKLRCVGAASLNNAIKASIIAKEESKRIDGTSFLLNPSFTTVSFQNGEKTGIVFDIIKN